MSTKKLGRLSLVVLPFSIVLAIATADSFAEEAERPMTLQVMAGEMIISNDDPDVGGGDYDIFMFGVAAQKPYYGDLLQAGIETGVLLNFESDTRAVAASGGGGGGTFAISAEIDQFLFDYFFGGYASIRPIKWLRLYIGAGPLLIYGSRETDETDPATGQVDRTSESGLSAGVYGRGGVDIVFTENFALGAGVRYTQTGLSFNETAAEVDVEGWQYFGVLSFRF